MQAHIVVKTVLINHALGKALLMRRTPDDFGNWEGPGGAVEENETQSDDPADHYGSVGMD